MAAEFSTHDSDRELFEHAIRMLQAEIANLGTHVTLDAYVRQRYVHDIAAMSAEYRQLATTGRLSWKQAAGQAHEMRNVIMDLMRSRSTPVGRAIAQKLKDDGKTFNEVMAKNTRKLYGSQADFSRLSTVQRGKVYAEIVNSAGRPDRSVTSLMHKLSPAGRSLVGLSLAVAVYNVATAEDKVATAAREGATLGAGIGGGVAGGALAAMGVSYFW